MSDPDLMLVLLRDIRAKVDTTNRKLDESVARIDSRIDELRDAVFASFDLIGEKLGDFVEQLRVMTHHQKVTVRTQIRSLDSRVTALERKVG